MILIKNKLTTAFYKQSHQLREPHGASHGLQLRKPAASALPLMVILWIAILALPNHPASAQAQEPVVSSGIEIVDSLPNVTVGWLHLNNVQQWRASFKDCGLQQIIGSRLFENFRKESQQLVNSKQFAARFGITLDELEQIGNRDVVVAWLPQSNDRIGIALVVDIDGQQAAVDKIATSMQARFSRLQYTERNEDLSNGQMSVFSGPENKLVASHRTDKRLIIGCDVNAVKRIANPDSNLASDAAMKFVMERVNSRIAEASTSKVPCNLRWFLRPWQFIEGGSRRPVNFDLLKSEGFQAIDAIGGRLTMTRDRIASYDFAAHVNGPLTRAATMLTTKPIEIKTPDWISDTFDEVQAIGLDPSAVLKGYASWFDATEGEGEQGLFNLVLEEIRDEPDAPGVDMRTEFFDQLESPVYSLRMNSAGDRSNNAVIAVKAKSPEVVSHAVGRMLDGDPDVHSIMIGSVSAWEFGDLTQGGQRQVLGPDLSGVTLCMFKGYLLASRTKAAIAQAIEPGGQPFSKTKRLESLRAVSSELAITKPTAFRYARRADWLLPIYEQLRNGFPDANLSGNNARQRAADSRAFWNGVIDSLRSTWVTTDVQSVLKTLPTAEDFQSQIGDAIDIATTVENGGWVVSGILNPPTKED